MINKNKFIALEGIDGSGKTTVCKLLSKKMKAYLYKTPSWPFANLREIIDKTVDIKSRFYFYLSSVFHASAEIEELLKKRHVVCDRYILSTLCYHRASGSSFKLFNETYLDIIIPDFTFFLNADYEVRMKRIAIREHIDHSDVLNSAFHDREYQDKVKYEFATYTNMVWVNTNDRSPKDVTELIYQEISK